MDAEFITRLPANDLGDACMMFLRQYGVGTSGIVRGGERLGVYFYEIGAMQRPGMVIYDREDSAASSLERGMLDWDAILSDAGWFHWTGITPAISESLSDVCLDGVRTASERGLVVSCDLNYRSKLWKWGKEPDEIMPELFKYCTVAVVSEDHIARMFGIRLSGADTGSVQDDERRFRAVTEKLVDRFPCLKTVAFTNRKSRSASHNSLSGMLLNDGKLYASPTYELTHIVDRLGSGDAFTAGLIYGLTTTGDPQYALNFAAASSCLNHGILGDFNVVTAAEVEELMSGDASGRVNR
jgi:2-dehydro-3-deoxygluconokinase